MRRGRQAPGSITGQVMQSTRMLMVILAIPVVLSLVVMLAYATRYHDSVSRMEVIAELMPMVDGEIAQELWEAISGQKDFADCGVYDTTDAINDALKAQIDRSGESGQFELIVARRTMDTLLGYVQRIEENLRSGAPVAHSEALLEEVRDVATLVGSMLQDYITQEIAFTARTNRNLRTIVILSALVEMGLLLLAMLLSRRMLRHTQRIIREPIEHLAHFAGLLADGDLSARIPHTNVEELDTLTDRYNTMADRLAELMRQNRLEQENLKKAELRLLQAQINPHFLYNTLDAIIWQAESGHSQEVIQLTGAMSDFFRISLSSGADWIPVSQEIKHLTGYLSIQKTRYRDILDYRIDMEEGLEDIYVLKLLLQPLVENALYHGIKNKRGGGAITVTGRREGDFLRFTVQDTGCGMTQQQLDDVYQRLMEKNQNVYVPRTGGSGFGLGNVDLRIRLYYDQQEGLHIQSGPQGTTVYFCVPVKTREESVSD